MPKVTNPSQSCLVFKLTQEQALHIAASLASDINCVADLMSKDFHQRHTQLLYMFMSKLSETGKSRALGAIPWQGVLQ